MGNKPSAPLPSAYPWDEVPRAKKPSILHEFQSIKDSAKMCAIIKGTQIHTNDIIDSPGLYDKKALLYVFDKDHNLIHGEMFKEEKIIITWPISYGFSDGAEIIPFDFISACVIPDKDLEERPDTNTHHTTQAELRIMCDPRPGPKWADVLYNPKKYSEKVLIYGKTPFGPGLLIQRFSSKKIYKDFRYNFSDINYLPDHEIHFCYPSNNQVNLHIDDPVSFIPGQRTGQCLVNAYETILFYSDVIRHVVLDELQRWLTYKELLALPETPVEKETPLTQFVRRSYPHADPVQLSFFEQIFFRYIYRQLLQFDIQTLQIIAPRVTREHIPSAFHLERRNSAVSTTSIEKILTTTRERVVAQTATNHNLYGTKALTMEYCNKFQTMHRTLTIMEPLWVPHISVFKGNSLNKFHFNKIKSAILAFHIVVYPPQTGSGHAIAIIKNNGEWYLCDGNIGLAKRIAREHIDFMLESLAVYYEDEPPHEFQMVFEPEATLYQFIVEGQAPTLLYRVGERAYAGYTKIYNMTERGFNQVFVDARAIGSEANAAGSEANAAVAKAKSDEAAAAEEAAAKAKAKHSAISSALGWLGPRIGGHRTRRQKQKKRRSTRK